MLLRNKIIIIISFLLIINIAYAQQCETSIVKSALKKALFDYLNNPSAAKVPVAEIRDLLKFYLTIAENEITVNCAVQGEETGIKMENIVNEAKSIITALPTCSDGTNYGECSSTKPKYCYNGKLIDKCSLCSCPSGKICQNNACAVPVQNITCTINSDCGSSGLIGNYFCQNNDVYKNYINYTCKNPGTTSSYCSSATMPILIDDCTGSEYCLDGINTCQVNVTTSQTNVTCTDTDGGIDIYTKGTTTGVWDFYTGFINVSIDMSTHTDYCRINYGYVNGLPKGVSEYYCNSQGRKSEQYYDCPNGCQDGTCIQNQTTNITCSINSNCGTSGYTGTYFCQNSDVYRNYINYTCLNPGTASSYCSSATTPVLIDDCAGNEYCAAGNSVCQVNQTTGCVGATKNNVCKYECGAFASCDSRSSGSEYACNSDKTYNSNGPYLCLCYAEYNCDGRIVQNNSCSSGGVWDSPYSADNICLATCGADQNCNLKFSTFEYRCNADKTPNAYGSYLCDCKPDCKSKIKCEGPLINGVCMLGCGSHQGCSGRSPGSEYRCNSNYLYNGTGSFMCRCGTDCIPVFI